MESISPSLKLALSLRFSIESGESVRQGIKTYLAYTDDEMSRIVAIWLSKKEQGQQATELAVKLKSPFRRTLLDCLERGLRGESILAQLSLLETEIIEANNDELERFTSLLPLKALVPLLLLQFPALFLLFLGPLLSQLTQSF